MPRSFLVRLRPSMENITEQKSDMSGSKGEKQSKTNTQSSDDIPSNLPAKAPKVTMKNDSSSTHGLGNQTRSHPDVMKSSHNSQSNSAMVMTSHHDNQSEISTVTPHHHVGPAFEIAMPPQYHIMPYYRGWGQYDWLPAANNNTWCYPSHISHVDNMQLKYPGRAERVVHTGEVALPVYSKDKSLYRTQQTVSETSKFPGALKEFFSVEQQPRTQHRKDNHTTNPATAQDLLPRQHVRSDQHIQNPTSQANEKPEQKPGQAGGKPSQTNEPSLSDKSNEDNGSTTISCKTSLSNPDNFKTQPTSNNPEKLHTCQQCNKTFNRASNLRAHMKTHSDHKPYKCDFCGKGFHQKIDKRIHHYTHTGEKPHKCEKCGRGFKQLTHLNYHMRTHSDMHMYHCTYCGKGFNQKGNLQAHIYGHTGQRPFKCKICNKGFTLRSTLNTHLRTHAPKKPFDCEYCNKAFYQKNALKMHHIASHPIVNGKSIL